MTNTTKEIVSNYQNEAIKEIVVVEKSKAKKKKVIKDEIQQNVINEFEERCKRILEDRVGSGLDVKSKKCKKCNMKHFEDTQNCRP